jgi:UPF0716 protein FxsA
VSVVHLVIARRLSAWPLWGAALLLVPFAEVGVLIASGRQFGVVPTVLSLVTLSALGGWLLTREGPRTFRALTLTVRAGRLPHRELVDGALVLVGATLLLTPGFLTDVVGMLVLAPPTRPLARRLVLGWISRRARRVVPGVPHTIRVPSTRL